MSSEDQNPHSTNPNTPNQEEMMEKEDKTILGVKVNEEYIDALRMPLERLSQYVEKLDVEEETLNVSVENKNLREQGIKLASGLKMIAQGINSKDLWKKANDVEQALKAPGQFTVSAVVNLGQYAVDMLRDRFWSSVSSVSAGSEIEMGGDATLTQETPSSLLESEYLMVKTGSPIGKKWQTVKGPEGALEEVFNPAIDGLEAQKFVLEGTKMINDAIPFKKANKLLDKVIKAQETSLMVQETSLAIPGRVSKALRAVAKRLREPSRLISDIIRLGKGFRKNSSGDKTPPGFGG